MSDDFSILDASYRPLILSLDTDSNNIAIIKEELAKHSQDIHCIFMYLSPLISAQIALLSPNYKDTHYFIKLITLFRLIRVDLGKEMSILPEDTCIDLTRAAIEVLNNYTAQDKVNHHSDVIVIIHSLIDLIKELLLIYPKDTSKKIGDSLLYTAFLSAFASHSSSIRMFLYSLVSISNNKFLPALRFNIETIFSHITNEISKAKDAGDILNELLSIADIFSINRGEFKDIYNDFYLILNQLVNCNEINKGNTQFKAFFKGLFALVFKHDKGYCFDIVNLMLQLYEEHINEGGLCKLIIASMFSKLQSDQYTLLSDNTDFISKFITTMHKCNDADVIEYYFKWLEMNTRTKPVIAEVKAIEPKEVKEPKEPTIIPMSSHPSFSREIKALSKIICLFNDNTPMLQLLCSKLQVIFTYQKDFLILFLDQIELYQGIDSLLIKKKPNGSMLFNYIKTLLTTIQVTESIFYKITQANLLQFDLCSKDELVFDKIQMSLLYEMNQDKFNTKCDKIIEKLNDLSFELQNRRDCFEENVNKFIEVFSILLQCFLNEKNLKVSPITIKLFKDMTDLLLEFSIALFEYESELKLVFKLWNIVFDFLYRFNMMLLRCKCRDQSNANGNSPSLTLEVPHIISKDHIIRFIYEGLNKCTKENSIMLLRYLYEKCLNYNSTQYEFEYTEETLDPLLLIKFKYVFPHSFPQSQSNEKRFSAFHLESQLILKCIIKAMLSMDNIDNILSLFSFIEFLCGINHINSSLMLRCGILKSLLQLLGLKGYQQQELQSNPKQSDDLVIDNDLDKRVLFLIEKLIRNFNRKDMELYLKQVYSLLIKSSNLTLSQSLLRIIYDNIDKSSSNRNSITLSPITSNNPQVYNILYMPNVLTITSMNDTHFSILQSLYTPSFKSLSQFTLCHIVSSTNGNKLIFIIDNNNIIVSANDKVIHSFRDFTKEFNKTSTVINPKTAKWYNFIIETTTNSNFSLIIDKLNVYLSIPHTVLIHYQIKGSLNMSIGYIDCINEYNSNKNSRLNFCESIPYVDISYILLMKGRIEISLVQEIDNKQINYSKGKSIGIIKSLVNKENTKVESVTFGGIGNDGFSHKNLITEVLFNDIRLENAANVPKVIERKKAMLYMPNSINVINDTKCDNNIIAIDNIDKEDYIPYITFNSYSKQDPDHLYLLKQTSSLDFASMNSIYSLSTLNKDYLQSKYYSLYSNLDTTLSNVFIADILFVYLTSMPSDLFLFLYITIFNIILKALPLRQLFFSKYFDSLPYLFINNASVLNSDFATCLLMNPEIPLGTLFSGQCIEIIYLNIHLFPLLTIDTQKYFIEKFYIYFHSSDVKDSVKECRLMLRLIRKLIDLLMHIELNKEIAELISSKIEELITMFFSNDEESIHNVKYNEVEMLSSQFSHYLSVIASFNTTITNKTVINYPDLQFLTSTVISNQMTLIEPLLKSYANEDNDSNIGMVSLQDDDCFLIDHFKLEFTVFKQSLKYTKRIKSINIMLRLSWPELFNDYSDYTWALSSKEGYCRMRKKIVLKSNDMSITLTPEALGKHIYSYEKYWVWLEKMALYDLYTSSSPLARRMVNSNDKYQSSFMCLLIKHNIKTESLLILGEKSMYIITNVIIDSKKKLHLSKVKTSNVFWARDDNDKEWLSIVNTDSKKRATVNEYNHNAAQIKIKTIRYDDIAQLHKKTHLHQKNSIELFTTRGSSYFLTVFPKNRDEVFTRILKTINKQSENTKIKNIQKDSGSNVIYLKHYPLFSVRTKRRKKLDVIREKTVIDSKALALELQEKWSHYPQLSNFNYLMTINTLAGRSYNDLTQYFTFPWMLKDFFTDKMDPALDVFYRDFSFPLHAQIKGERDLLKKKFEMKQLDDKIARERYEKSIAERRKRGEKIDKDERYVNFPIQHSGNFYSNFTFVCYYLFRTYPFTSIAFSVEGTFNHGDRCFNCLSFFSEMKTKYQEWVPELFYFPEMMVNINSLALGVMTVTGTVDKNGNNGKGNNKEKKTINDVGIPPWAEMDPRTVGVIFNKIFEGHKVSAMLHYWIDLVFGYKMIGKECIESLNLFGEACYPYEDLKEKKFKDKELCQLLNETENMGCCAIQLFNKPHVSRKVLKANFNFSSNGNNALNANSSSSSNSCCNESYTCFYEKNKSIALASVRSNDIKCILNSKSIGDFKARYELPKHNSSRGEGGLLSLHQYIDRKNHDDLDEDIKHKRRTYYAVGKHKSLIGPKFNMILSHSHTSVYITIPKYSFVFGYHLNESSASISKVISSIDGKYIIVGFTNGMVIKYRKRNMHKETIAFPPNDAQRNKSHKKSFDTSFKDYKHLHSSCHCKPIYAKFIYYDNGNIKDFDFWSSAQAALIGTTNTTTTATTSTSSISIQAQSSSLSSSSSTSSLLTNKPKPIAKKQLKQYYLIEDDRTGIAIDSITNMALCESYSFLLIIDKSNNIYQYNFNKLKLLYKFNLKSISICDYSIKYAKIIPKTGDYIVGTKYSLHLFSINGVPLAEMNIFTIVKPCPPITALEAVAVYDTIIFTGHSNGEVNIWRLKTDSYAPTSSENDYALFRTYHQRYQCSFKPKQYSFGIQKRELDDMRTFRESKAKIIMIKLTDEGNRLYYVNKEMKIYRVGLDDCGMGDGFIKAKTYPMTSYSGNVNVNINGKVVICKQCKRGCEEICSSMNSSGLCYECSQYNSNSSLSDRLIFDL